MPGTSASLIHNINVVGSACKRYRDHRDRAVEKNFAARSYIKGCFPLKKKVRMERPRAPHVDPEAVKHAIPELASF